MTRTRVAIVGAGLAGMSAALALREQDVALDITLYESKRAAGGRAGSFVDAQSAESVDYCQHVAMGCCTNLLSLLRRTGLDSAFTRYRSLSFQHPNHAATAFDKSSLLPEPLHLLPSLLRLPYLSWRQKIEIGRATFAMMRSRPDDVASLAAYRWLIEHGQSVETIRDYWDVVIASALGESCQQVSMSAARKVFVDGFLATRDASDVYVPSMPLAMLFGQKLLAEVVRQGVNVKLGSKVKSVTNHHERSLQVMVDKETFEFDQVILAVPFFAIGKVLNQATAIAAGFPEDRYAGVPCSPITGIHLWFDRPILEQPHAVLVGTLAQWVFRRETERRVDAPDLHYVQVVISAAHGLRQAGTAELIAQGVSELRQILPLAAQANLILSRVVTDRQAVFSVRPEIETIRPQAQTAIRGLHLAGDFVQTGWPATMEGAIISGRLAASSLLKNIGCEPVMIEPGLRRSWLTRRLIR